MPDNEADVHEALITRGHVQGQKDNAYLAFHPYNCVFRHHSCPPKEVTFKGDTFVTTFFHGGGVGGDLVFERCSRYLMRYEGYDHIVEYLQAMAGVFPQAGNEALRRFLALHLVEDDSALLMEYESKLVADNIEFQTGE